MLLNKAELLGGIWLEESGISGTVTGRSCSEMTQVGDPKNTRKLM